MEHQSENNVSSLKHLLSICNDGKEGYANASENVDAPELKALLTTYSIQRSEYASNLKSGINQAGGHAGNDDEGGPLGFIHRTWINIKTVFTSNDNKAVLDACITGERAAIEAYEKVLQEPSLHISVGQLLSAQLTGIKESLHNVEGLVNQYA